jgi:P-type E1-E2 ATPase
MLLTGDSEIRAHEVAKGLPFSEIHANCLPENKVTVVSEATTENKTTVMVGDGINDSPALKSASVGIALGTHGETALTDAADAVISSDDLYKLPRLLTISHKTVRIAKESMLIGIGLSVALMFLAIMGGVPPLYGAILQEIIDVVVIFNALRALV